LQKKDTEKSHENQNSQSHVAHYNLDNPEYGSGMITKTPRHQVEEEGERKNKNEVRGRMLQIKKTKKEAYEGKDKIHKNKITKYRKCGRTRRRKIRI